MVITPIIAGTKIITKINIEALIKENTSNQNEIQIVKIKTFIIIILKIIIQKAYSITTILCQMIFS